MRSILRVVLILVFAVASIGSLGCGKLKAKDRLNEGKWYAILKEVAHRVNKNPSWFFPAQRYVKHVFMQGQGEAVGIIWLPHGLQSFCHAFCIAVFATWRQLGAASHRVPGVFRPFDR